MIRRIIPFFTFLFIAFVSQFTKADNFFHSTTFVLDNGLTVIAIENHRAPVVTHMVFYKTGSANDPINKTGIAHLLEHLMFKGTKIIPKNKFSEIVHNNGGIENAFTSYDFTAYYQNIAKEHLELVMFLEADRMTNLNFSDQDFIPELDVVKEERLMRTDNNPNMVVQELRNKILWGNHEYGRPIIGYKSDLDSLTAEDAYKYYKTNYSPENAFLIVSGDITPEELRPLAEKYYGSIPPNRKAKEKKNFREIKKTKTTIEYSHPQAKVKTLTKTYVVPSYFSSNKELAPAFDILSTILFNPDTGIIYKKLINSKKITSLNYTYNGFRQDYAELTITSLLPESSEFEDVDTIINKRVKITKKSLEAAKKRLLNGLEFLIDSPETTANTLGYLMVLGMTPEEIEKYPEKIQNTFLPEVLMAYRFLEKRAATATTYLYPEGNK
ncbi:MAG: insulinase family protein [Alphaproteobacteria bacterium]|nr:insulinase family protein [Alphaproteobacteria bacterium]